MKVDVRENLERAAKDELLFNDSYVCLVGREVAEKEGWSGDVRLKFSPDSETGLVEIVVEERSPSPRDPSIRDVLVAIEELSWKLNSLAADVSVLMNG